MSASESDRVAPVERLMDHSALLVALVLVPHSYPRNKFYELFRHPEAWAVRRRAARLRSVIADLTEEATEVTLELDDRGEATLRYRLDELGATRVCHLSPDELALVKLATDRVRERPELIVSGDVASRVSELVAGLMG